VIPFEFYEWWQDIAYIRLGAYTFTVSWLLPYEGLSPKIIDQLTKYESVVLADTSIRIFQGTEDVRSILQFLTITANKLSRNYSLVYASGNPFNTVWLR
jgi:hypothetical protein